ncbi:MAG TPA: hypothetical protein VGM88_21725 [Kofleriaceae bacterium]|nr:hypothetical protein [Kofleriaceae bacterium]
MIVDQRIRSSHALAVALALGACTAPSTGDPSGSAADAGTEIDIVARSRRPPPPPPRDAGTHTPDASAPTGGGGGDLGQPGVYSCYTEGNPGASCASPSYCCWGNYSSAHDGSCSAYACGWATQSCDGPEDCGAGQHCCGHVLSDPDWGIYGYQIACQASACGSAPMNQEMCHPTSTSAAGTCSSGTSCVTALGNDSDLPPNLHICR